MMLAMTVGLTRELSSWKRRRDNLSSYEAMPTRHAVSVSGDMGGPVRSDPANNASALSNPQPTYSVFQRFHESDTACFPWGDDEAMSASLKAADAGGKVAQVVKLHDRVRDAVYSLTKQGLAPLAYLHPFTMATLWMDARPLKQV